LSAAVSKFSADHLHSFARGGVAAAREPEVNLVPTLVTSMVRAPDLQMCMQFVENVVLPEQV
jgi:hypothetical protein